MEHEEKISFLIQDCLEEIEQRTGDFTAKVFLNYNLYDDDGEKEKLRFVNKNIKRLKKELGKLKGEIAYYLDVIYSRKINFPDYIDFYDMANKCLVEHLREFIKYRIHFNNEKENTENRTMFVEGKKAVDYPLLKTLLEAISSCLNLFLLEDHEPNFKENIESTLNQDFYPNRNTSELIKFKNGRRLNLKERYIMLDEFIGLESAIRTLNIKNEEKEKFLAYLLHCNPKNAQQILNGTYDAKVREYEIKEYLKSIKKE